METTKAPGIRAVCLAEPAQTQAGVAGDVLADPPSFETFANLDHSAHPPPSQCAVLGTLHICHKNSSCHNRDCTPSTLSLMPDTACEGTQ